MTAALSRPTLAAELRERVRAQVRTSRRAQGLGPHITDTATLDRLAGRVLDQAAEAHDLPGAIDRTLEP